MLSVALPENLTPFPSAIFLLLLILTTEVPAVRSVGAIFSVYTSFSGLFTVPGLSLFLSYFFSGITVLATVSENAGERKLLGQISCDTNETGIVANW